MEPHNDWINSYLMGDTKVYTSFLVHTNDITAIEEKITAIKDPKTCRNLSETSRVLYSTFSKSQSNVDCLYRLYW